MFKLYLMIKENEKMDIRTAEAVQMAVKEYADEEPMLFYDEKGKPYFKNSDIKLSVSHSGIYWGCILGKGRCGLDIQEMRECNYLALADRFFTVKESEYVKEHGINGYYQVWTMREAAAKYSGQGFFMRERPELVGEDGNLKDQSVIDGKKVYYHWEGIDKEYMVCWCSEKEDECVSIEVMKYGEGV